jgi:NADH:ubiquinone oxidoreductase subunit F (NADH-binding)
MALLAAQRRRPVIAVNTMEGEPASHKDEVLATSSPHLVLDGAELVARALGAVGIKVCVAHDRPATANALAFAIDERAAAGLLSVPTEVVTPPGRYVSGEESALVHWLDGGESTPTFRVEKPTILRVGGRPTLVDNAETMANIGLIGRYGPVWFREVGAPDAPGTTLLTVSGAVSRPGIYEIPLGTRVDRVLTGAGADSGIAAVLLGGYGGAWLGPQHFSSPLTPSAMATAGASIGAGVVVALATSSCGLAETARIAHWMAGESAGQCGPCVFGLPAIAEDLTLLAAGRSSHSVLERLCHRLDEVEGRGACGHPDGVVRIVRSALSVFADDLASHLRSGPCPGSRAHTVLALPGRDGGPWR